jgi:phospholipid/cholesterol/gamma-HCH transport system substrate-binding protein
VRNRVWGPGRRLAGFVAGLVAASLVLSGCEFDGAYDLPLPGSPVDEDDSFTVTADFVDVLNVVPRSTVMVDDVTVGEVIEVDRIGWHARVTMRIRNGTRLPDNATAAIRQASLLGEKYVALEDPTDEEPQGELSDGDEIKLDSTGRNPEVEEVLGALSFLLSGGGVGQLGTITRELNEVMSGREDRVRHLLGSLESVIGTLDDQKVQIVQALESMNNLTATLNSERDTIGEALDVMGPAVKVLSDQHDELIEMLTALERLGQVGTRVIGASKEDLIRTLAHLRPILTELSKAGDSLAPGLDMLVSFPFPKEAANVVKGDYANASIRAGINLETFLPDGDGNPIPIPVPDPEEVLSAVQKCLESADLTSKACQKVLADLDLYQQLKKACAKDKNEDNPVCQVINQLPGGDGDGDGEGDGDGDPLPDLPDLPLLGLRSLDDALSSGLASPTSSWAGLVGGGAVIS